MPPTWLPFAALVFIVAASAARVWAVERAHNVKAFSFGKHAAIQSLAERHWKMAVALAFAVAAVSWLAPEWEALLGRVAFAQGALQWIATGLSTFSALVIVVAQVQMGASWRVGVPKEGPGALVTNGLFAWSGRWFGSRAFHRC